jgi:hypothetical protein
MEKRLSKKIKGKRKRTEEKNTKIVILNRHIKRREKKETSRKRDRRRERMKE